jgi:hypothetical protein
MHRGHEAEFPGEREVVRADLECRVVRAQHGQAERHEGVAIRQRASQQPLYLLARMRHLGEVRLAGLGIGLGRAMEEGGANAAFLQAGDAGIAVLRRGIIVAPVDQRGHAMVELIEGAGQRRDVDVFGREDRREAGMNVAEILEQRPVRRDRA